MKKALIVDFTFDWLEDMNNFENFVDQRKLNMFICEKNGKYEVIDIENYDKSKQKNSQKVIDSYRTNGYKWNKEYYQNIKDMLD